MEPEKAPILRDYAKELVGPRIVVRPVRPGEGAAVFEAVEESRAELSPWMPWAEKTRSVGDSEEAVRRFASQWMLRDELTVGLWHKETGQYLGSSGLHRIDWTVPSFEIGYWLRTSVWGHGYVSEAVQLLCTFAFETLGANRLEIRCDACNTRSAAVPERLGFPLEATLRNSQNEQDGILRDTLIFALIPEDYAQVKAHWAQPQQS